MCTVVQDQATKNTSTGPALPLHGLAPDCTSHQLHDLQHCSTVCHVWQSKIPIAGKKIRMFLCECAFYQLCTVQDLVHNVQTPFIPCLYIF